MRLKFIGSIALALLAFLYYWKGILRTHTLPVAEQTLPSPGPLVLGSNQSLLPKKSSQQVSQSAPVASPGNQRQPAQAAEAVEGLSEWLTPYQSQSGLRIRKGPEGQVTMVSGLKYPSHWKQAEDGLEFAQKFASLVEVPRDQVVVATLGVPPETDVTEIFRYGQEVSGYPVFGAFLQMTQSKTSGDGFLIVNELRDLGTPNLDNNFSSTQIEEIIKEKFGPGTLMAAERNKQQIYPVKPGESELAWAYSLDIIQPGRDRRLVLVSARDGRILFDQSLVVH